MEFRAGAANLEIFWKFRIQIGCVFNKITQYLSCPNLFGCRNVWNHRLSRPARRCSTEIISLARCSFLWFCFASASRLPSSAVCELPVVARLGDGPNRNLGEILNNNAMWWEGVPLHKLSLGHSQSQRTEQMPDTARLMCSACANQANLCGTSQTAFFLSDCTCEIQSLFWQFLWQTY